MACDVSPVAMFLHYYDDDDKLMPAQTYAKYVSFEAKNQTIIPLQMEV